MCEPGASGPGRAVGPTIRADEESTEAECHLNSRFAKQTVPAKNRGNVARFPDCGTPRAGRARRESARGLGWRGLGQADARRHQPGPILGRPPAGHFAGAGHDEEKGQLGTFEIEHAAMIIEIEPPALEILAMRSVHDRSVAGAGQCCEPMCCKRLTVNEATGRRLGQTGDFAEAFGRKPFERRVLRKRSAPRPRRHQARRDPVEREVTRQLHPESSAAGVPTRPGPVAAPPPPVAAPA